MSDDNGNNNDDRRQRQMDFILEQQAQFTVDIQLLKEVTTAQAAASAAEFEQVKERLTRAEQLLYGSLEGQDALRQDVRALTTVVDRIGDAIAFLLDREAARGQNSNGTNGQG
jgi:hypothetical protein